ncbi:MAG: cation:proton antiporter [Acetobacteraceae bacterium]|nr:cation:proton antiporter [Acetobacteraceae bacterium]
MADELREAVVLLAAAGLVGWLAHRLRIGVVLGFLLVGALLGPYALGRVAGEGSWLSLLVIEKSEGLHVAAELGVAFLLFMIGLELSLARLWRMRALVFGLGGAQVVVTGGAIGLAVWAFGHAPAVALVLGLALALSSTAIVMQLLTERGQLGAPVGRSSFAVLLAQDLAVVPVLFLVGILGASADAGPVELALDVLRAVGKALLAVAAILVLGRLVLRPVLRAVAETRSREAFLAAILLAVIGTALATEAAGMSLALGAFLAGVLLAETEYRPQIEVDLEPFKGLLMGAFFVSVGLGLDVGKVLADPLRILGSAVGLVLLKAAILYALARLAREERPVAAEAALLLGQGGEFAFIVLALGTGVGLIPLETAGFVGLVVGLTMAATPGLAALGRRAARRLEGPAPAAEHGPEEAGELSGHVIIAGYGRVGRAVGEMLDTQRVPHIAVESRIGRVARLRRDGAAVFYGDASQAEMLARLGAARAAALVLTMDDPERARSVAEAARRSWPRLPIHARARDEAHARALLEAGATHVVPEAAEASLQLGEGVLVEIGVPDDAARALVAERREALRAGIAPLR